jgi:replicative DNA helicase
MDQAPKFQNDRHFEERIIQALIVDHKFAEQMLEVLDLSFFNFDYLKEVASIMFEHHKKYRSFPSFKLLAGIVKKDIEEGIVRDQIMAYLVKIRKEPLNGDLEYVKDQSLDFCRKRSLACALETTLDLIEDQRYDQIVPVVQKALVAGSERDVGHHFIDDFEKRMQIEIREPIPTPWEDINGITQGGPSGGDLCVLCAPTGVGKSHGLVNIGYHALMLGCNVAHYTLELGEKNIAHRYDARITGIPPEQLVDHKDQVREMLESVPGKLIIKAYPTKSATVLTLKSHIHKLIMMDMKPDVIVLDYGDLMRSQHHYDQKRLEEESVYEDLSGLSKELNIPIWTATQTNREGLDAEVITLKHIAECFGKAMISDFFLTMARNKESTYTNIGNFFVAKSRLGPDGIKYPILLDTALSKIEILSPDDAIEGGSGDKEADLHARLRRSYKNFKQNGGSGE